MAAGGLWAWRVLRVPAVRPLPAEVVAPPGTELPDGFTVPEGALLLGPVLLRDAEADPAAGWTAILVVEADPLEVWRRLAAGLAERYPAAGLNPEDAPGCAATRRERFRCGLTVSGEPEASGTPVTEATLSQPMGDVTGRYLAVLSTSRQRLAGLQFPASEPPAWEGGEAPRPEPARETPDVGEALAPDTTAYESDDRRYVLLEGSELLAQWGEGSLTGGFDVLLRVAGGAEVERVAEGYARQAAQLEGRTEVVEYRSGGTEFTRYLPPGGAGGYSGAVWAVDRPDGVDYVFYSLTND